MTINCAPWVYAPEILPLHVRLRAATLANGVQWIWVSTIIQALPCSPLIFVNRTSSWWWSPQCSSITLEGRPTSFSWPSLYVVPPKLLRLSWIRCPNPLVQYAFVPIVYFFFPETSGLSLEGIDYLFLEGGPASTPFVKAAGKRNVQNNPSMNLESFTDKKAVEVEETRVEGAPAAWNSSDHTEAGDITLRALMLARVSAMTRNRLGIVCDQMARCAIMC